MTFYFKNTNEDTIMTKEDEEHYRKNNICRFCEENIESDKVRDHCHLTGFFGGAAHNNSNIVVRQKK